MREIKFRAWDVTDERMYYNVTNISDINGYIMQYTGLKDENGREIYEGDILDGSYTNPLTKKDVKKYFQVVYENGCYNAHAKNHPFGSTVLYFVNTKRRVIGNIYENPELLEHGDD